MSVSTAWFKTWLLRPFQDNGALCREKRHFNKELSKCRIAVEHAFGQTKGRWRILEKRSDKKTERTSDSTIGCCVLHNICILRSEGPVEEDNEDEDITRKKTLEAVLPDYWVSQPTDPTTGREDEKHIFLLDPLTDAWEYGKVADQFRQSCTYSIIKIYRFQDPGHYTKYASRKEIMDKESAQGSNEMWLFYGASVWACDQIVSGGLSKIRGDYGNGLYFALQASYSVPFSPPDTNGHRYVYLEKVLVGEYAAGSPDLLQPPPKNVNNPQKRYDSVVDDVNNPSIFVVFNDDQCYPDYLITFK